MGADDIALAEYCLPPLTTVAQPFPEMGALAVSHLMRHLEDRDAEPEPVSVEPALIVRASTGPVERNDSRAR